MDPFKPHKGKAYVLDRADVDTDQIIPKQFLKRVERSGFGKYLFYDWVKSGEIELDEEATILVTGRNFGCGSSREHAPWAIQDFGFKVIIAPSFADIFYTNCTKIGLLPVVLAEDQISELMDVEEAAVDLERKVVGFSGDEYEFEIDPHVHERLLKGLDDIALTLKHADKIEQHEKRQDR